MQYRIVQNLNKCSERQNKAVCFKVYQNHKNNCFNNVDLLSHVKQETDDASGSIVFRNSQTLVNL